MGFHLERLYRTPPTDWWAMVILNPLGFRCGYVHVPPDHPAVGHPPSDLAEVPVHGGVNFSGEYPGGQLDNGDGVPPGWWIGFDCGHAGDAPEPGSYTRLLAALAAEHGIEPWPGTHIWTTEEVVMENARLAVMLAGMTEARQSEGF